MRDEQVHAATSPMDTVRDWWQALQDKDAAALASTLDDRHLSAGGPRGRTFDKEAALADARQFLRAGSVETWSIADVVERIHGEVAVCSYSWQETGRHDGSAFSLAGVATDVLRRQGSGWVITAHHTSVDG